MIKRTRNIIAAVLLTGGTAAVSFGVHTYIQMSNSLAYRLRQTFRQQPLPGDFLDLSRFTDTELLAYGSIAAGAAALLVGMFLLFTGGTARSSSKRRR
ncbi:hypothetical protein [Spirochaeta dissipatitropha]